MRIVAMLSLTATVLGGCGDEVTTPLRVSRGKAAAPGARGEIEIPDVYRQTLTCRPRPGVGKRSGEIAELRLMRVTNGPGYLADLEVDYLDGEQFSNESHCQYVFDTPSLLHCSHVRGGSVLLFMHDLFLGEEAPRKGCRSGLQPFRGQLMAYYTHEGSDGWQYSLRPEPDKLDLVCPIALDDPASDQTQTSLSENFVACSDQQSAEHPVAKINWVPGATAE